MAHGENDLPAICSLVSWRQCNAEDYRRDKTSDRPCPHPKAKTEERRLRDCNLHTLSVVSFCILMASWLAYGLLTGPGGLDMRTCLILDFAE